MLLTISSYAQENPLLIEEINNALKKRCLDDEQTAISIVAIPSGERIYSQNIYKPLLPASVMKIVTTAAALHYLGPEYRFKTKFLYTGERQGDSIQGDFIIQGGGDPKLSTEQLWSIAARVKASGIKEITGNLIIDTHFFDQNERAPSWDFKPTQRPYDARLGALSVNYNTVAVHIQPGSYAGEELNAWLDPAPTYMYLNNNGKTTSRRRNTISVYRTEGDDMGGVEMRVRGKLPLGSKEKVVYINIENPSRYAAETFRAYLQQLDVTIKGSTQFVSAPVFAKELYTHISSPLSLILKELNTFSSNFMAEQIIKTIAAERYGTPGSHAEGLKLVEEFLRIIGVNAKDMHLADGSGLSRKNQITAKMITDLLIAMYSRFDIGPDFLSSLRVMGAYGVLSQRLANSPAQGQIRAKTGSLSGVSTLAGYVASTNGQLFAYALFLNQNRCGHWGADSVEDRIVTAIHNYTTPSPSIPDPELVDRARAGDTESFSRLVERHQRRIWAVCR
ncbi:MAG: D-alanyl-D-alanine carboxypeptidase/D-alanyl-D-alanine-endopeptidase, partial [Pseudomonadota bacterium]|nr:D-alanyl-D-alanine carboxypeptidase/D-alanyl-D-alanine-endopeptidase [Pseudomonadota bacterium]